jgi:hypothetical protein
MVHEAVSKPRDDLELKVDPVEESTDFKYSNIDPDDDLKHEVKSLIHRLYEHAPDGSVIRGTLKKAGRGYKGALRIIHGGGQMLVVGIQKSKTGTLQLLEERIWGKIRKWRKTRFRDLENSAESG